MDERRRIARLHRRVGLGLLGGELDAAVGRGVAAEVARLADPAAAGVAPAADPFDGLDLSFEQGAVRQKNRSAVEAWMTAMAQSGWPVADRFTWFWHGLLVSSIGKVKAPDAMANQIRLFRRATNFGELIADLSIDPAMLTYLDGKDSVKGSPNENYGRELLELFTLGVGHFTEADVVATATALTGWVVAVRAGGNAVLRPKLHDSTPQTLLGRTGVNDVAGVVAAVLAHPECAAFVARRYLVATVGPAVDEPTVNTLAASFRASGYSLAVLTKGALDLIASGVDGGPVILGPVPWLVLAERATGARLSAQARLLGLEAAGQVPFAPPNVGGWAEGGAWFASAVMVGRLNLALAVAKATPPSSPAMQAVMLGDWGALSVALGLPDDLGPTTTAGLGQVRDSFSRLALALVSPEFVEA